MEFIKILFNIAFTVLPLLLQLLLQIPAARTTSESKFQNAETTTIATSTATNSQTSRTTTTTRTTAATTATSYNKNKNNITTRELRKHEQIIDNSIDFTVDPCDDFYQYACGEWKQQLYDDEDISKCEDLAGQTNAFVDKTADKNDKYDRTLAMIDYLADKEVLKYFSVRNMTKNFKTTQTSPTSSSPSSSTSSSTSSSSPSPATTKTTAATKEPDFIIKVYKYYKSCIAIQQYEPIKYLEWLELNEHVKWPSLINTTSTNSEQHDFIKHDQQQQQQQQPQHDANFTAEEIEDDIIMDDDDDDDENIDEEQVNDEEESAQDYNATWINTLAILRKYGMNGIFIEEVIYSTKTYPSKLLLGFNKPVKDGGFKSLKSEHLKSILSNLNLSLTADNFKNLWLQVTKFEWQLTKLNDISDELGTTMITLEHLPVPWLNNYLTVIFNQPVPLDLNIRIVITNVAYFMALDDLLSEHDDTFLNQYLQIRFLWHLFQQEPQDFQPIECILHIKHFIPLAFEWIYEQQNKHLIQEIPQIHTIYNNLRKQFNLTLYNNKNNFNSSTLEHFVTKLESIQLKVGTFSEMDQEDFFYENRKFYNQLKLSSNEFYFNHLKMLKFNFDALHFGMRSITTNSLFYDLQEYNQGLTSAPYFNKRLNILHIPLSLLQPPLYHKEFHDIYKYSSLGFIVAQTLMYGFNVNSLTTADRDRLALHFKCLDSLDPLGLNDKIADASGLRLAYHTFVHTSANNLISNRKKFFLNVAQTFCGSRTLDDNLGRSHINYALAQFPEFAKTFECSPDSHMNPHEKCYLWN